MSPEGAYRVVWLSAAEKRLKKIPTAEDLGANPRPYSVDKVVATGEYRIRVGDYRVRFGIDDAAKSDRELGWTAQGRVQLVTRLGSQLP